MCRLLGWVSSSDRTLRDVLGDASFVAFAQLSRIHADGWGLATVDGPDIAVRRSTACAATDARFHEVAGTVGAPAGVAHLRWASPGLPVEPRNAHPFRHGRRAFAHNGLIQPFDRLGDLLPEPWRARLTGTTDSEHYFLAVLAELERAGDDDVPAAVARVTRRLAEEYSASSLNAMLLTPDALHVINCYDPDLRPVLPPEKRSLTVESEVEAIEEEAAYFGLRYRRADSSVVVASSGFAQPEGGGWQQIPDNSVLVVSRASLAVELVPLDTRLGQATAALQKLGSDLR
jgi:predicted glutamine amidotransferase